MKDDNGNRAVGAKSSKLTFHAVERLLERSERAPSWLAQVLNQGQFAHVAFAYQKQKPYVLVFDVLSNTYLVPVLPAKTRTVITVLTQAQYERTHGAIAPVIFQLARLARTKKVETVAGETEEELTPQKRLAKKQARRWNATWRVSLVLQPIGRKQEKLRMYLDSVWRQECLTAEFAKSETSSSAHLVAAELTFEQQASLLGRSPEFLTWLAEKIERHGEDLESLVSVTVLDVQHKKVNLTKTLSGQLSGQVYV